MLVETFEAIETDAGGEVECDAEAIALIEELGLEGQRKLINKTGDAPARNPYRKMSIQERFAFRALMPKHVALDKYSDGPIPLRVLQVAAHAKGMFKWVRH